MARGPTPYHTTPHHRFIAWSGVGLFERHSWYNLCCPLSHCPLPPPSATATSSSTSTLPSDTGDGITVEAEGSAVAVSGFAGGIAVEAEGITVAASGWEEGGGQDKNFGITITGEGKHVL